MAMQSRHSPFRRCMLSIVLAALACTACATNPPYDSTRQDSLLNHAKYGRYDQEDLAAVEQAYRQLDRDYGCADAIHSSNGKHQLQVITSQLTDQGAAAVVNAKLITELMVDEPIQPSTEAILSRAFTRSASAQEVSVWTRNRSTTAKRL